MPRPKGSGSPKSPGKKKKAIKRKPKDDSKPTGKQQKWLDAYLGPANCNAAEAARMAGYAFKNPAHAAQVGDGVKKSKNVQAALNALMPTNTTAADTLAAWHEIAFAKNKQGDYKWETNYRLEVLKIFGRLLKCFGETATEDDKLNVVIISQTPYPQLPAKAVEVIDVEPKALPEVVVEIDAPPSEASSKKKYTEAELKDI